MYYAFCQVDVNLGSSPRHRENVSLTSSRWGGGFRIQGFQKNPTRSDLT